MACCPCVATMVHDGYIQLIRTTTGDRIAITSDNQCNTITWVCNSVPDSILGCAYSNHSSGGQENDTVLLYHVGDSNAQRFVQPFPVPPHSIELGTN